MSSVCVILLKNFKGFFVVFFPATWYNAEGGIV